MKKLSMWGVVFGVLVCTEGYTSLQPALQPTQKRVDQAAVNRYTTKEYALGQLQNIFAHLKESYPVGQMTTTTLDEIQARIIDDLRNGLSEFKAKSAAGKIDDALKAVRFGYYAAKVSESNMKNFPAGPRYNLVTRKIQSELRAYLSTPLGDGHYVVDAIRGFENWLRSQSPAQTEMVQRNSNSRDNQHGVTACANGERGNKTKKV